MANPRELITKNRADLSQFLIHLTKDGHFEEYFDTGAGFFDWKERVVQAEASLKHILAQPPSFKISALSPLGYFKYFINILYKGRFVKRAGVQPDWIKCVCFSEAPLSELSSFYRATVTKRNDYRKFGLAFWQDSIRKKGGNPIFYFDYGNKPLVSSVEVMVDPGVVAHVKAKLPLYQEYGPRKYPKLLGDRSEIDFRWEREWRVLGDLAFAPADVAFGICPEPKISEMEKHVGGSIHFLDPDWNITKLKSELEKKGAKRLLAAL